ncbi:unnamed protein product [Heterobilharzia americana]|nr:unnamed protein product [Heterobilharzia americana]
MNKRSKFPRSCIQSQRMANNHLPAVDIFDAMSSIQKNQTQFFLGEYFGLHKKLRLNPNGSFVERVYKVIFVGDSGVGKSSIIRKFVSGVFDLNLPLTVAIDFHVKFMHCDGTNLYLQLWDTAGQEKFRSITRQYYRKSDGVIIVFDATNEASFLAVRSWLQSVTEETDENTVILILENKSDLLKQNDSKRCVPKAAVDKIVQAYKTMCFEVSAKTGENIEEAFTVLARKLKEKEVYELHTLHNLKKEEITRKNTCCR